MIICCIGTLFLLGCGHMPWKIATRVQQHVAAKLKAISRVINIAEGHAAQPPQCGVDVAIAAVK